VGTRGQNNNNNNNNDNNTHIQYPRTHSHTQKHAHLIFFSFPSRNTHTRYIRSLSSSFLSIIPLLGCLNVLLCETLLLNYYHYYYRHYYLTTTTTTTTTTTLYFHYYIEVTLTLIFFSFSSRNTHTRYIRSLSSSFLSLLLPLLVRILYMLPKVTLGQLKRILALV